MTEQPDTPLPRTSYTNNGLDAGLQSLIGDLRTEPAPDSPEQQARARIRGLARSVVGAMRADDVTTANAQASAIVEFPQYGAAPGIAAEHLADLARKLAAWPLRYLDTPEFKAAAPVAVAVLNGGADAAAAAEQMRRDDNLAGDVLLLLGHHVRSIVDYVAEWAEGAEIDYYDAIDDKDTSQDRRDL